MMAPQSSHEISRRAVFRVAGGVLLGAAGMPLLAACTPSAPVTATAGAKVKLPTYVALGNLAAADLPGTPDRPSPRRTTRRG